MDPPAYDPIADNPFSCHIDKDHVETGPCCHSSYRDYTDINTGDTIENCFITFKTEFCNTVSELISDDDFR